MKNRYNRYRRVCVILLCTLLINVNSCKEDDDPAAQLPALTTVAIAQISPTTATSGGNITDDGLAEVTTRGVCWSANANPTVSDFKTSDGNGTGIFSSSLTGLTENTIYHVRAYATNKIGTAYGDDVTFTTNNFTVPTLLPTTPASSIGQTSALSGGIISSDGGSAVTSRGVCWATSHNPTTIDDKTTDGSGTGSFTSTMTGLTGNTTYYVRAYATNSIGTAYGDETPFTTRENGIPGDVSDVDGNTYNSVAIGSQIWMTENLKTTKYNDGTDIAFITDSLGWLNDQLGAYTWFHNDIDYKNVYGALYNWYAVNTTKLCPNGWHAPTEDEWITLENYLIANGYNYDGSTNGDWTSNNKIAKALADVTTGITPATWVPPATPIFQAKEIFWIYRTGSRREGFLRFVRFFLSNGHWFPYAGVNGEWWSSSEIVPGATTAWWHVISTNGNGLLRSHNEKYYGLSVRCAA